MRKNVYIRVKSCKNSTWVIKKSMEISRGRLILIGLVLSCLILSICGTAGNKWVTSDDGSGYMGLWKFCGTDKDGSVICNDVKDKIYNNSYYFFHDSWFDIVRVLTVLATLACGVALVMAVLGMFINGESKLAYISHPYVIGSVLLISGA